MREYTGKFKVGDIVNAITDSDIPDFVFWKKAKIVGVVTASKAFPYVCTCEHYGEMEGLFAEDELELAE